MWIFPKLVWYRCVWYNKLFYLSYEWNHIRHCGKLCRRVFWVVIHRRRFARLSCFFFFFLCISALILSVTCFVVILFIVIVLFFFMFCNQFIVQLQPFLSEQRDSVNVSSLNNSFLSLGKRYFIIKELQLILKNFKNFIICSFGEIWDVCLSQAFFMSFFYSHSFNLFLFLIFFFMAFVFLMNYFEEIFVELNKINKTPTEVVIPIGSAIDVSGVLDNLPNLKKMLHDFETCKSAPKFVNTLFRLIHYFFSVFLYVYFLVTFYIIVLNILYFLHNYSFIFLSNPYLTNLWVFLFWALAPIFFIFSLKLLMLRLKKRGFSSVQIFKILVIVLSLIALFTLIGLFVILFI